VTRDRAHTFAAANEPAPFVQDDDSCRGSTNHDERRTSCQLDDLDTVRSELRHSYARPLQRQPSDTVDRPRRHAAA
jgi:hypothetical protein